MQLSNLTIGYGVRVVQKDLNLQIRRGELICVLGPNGCGKSTLLRTLAGLQPALAGSCTIENPDKIDVFAMSEKEKARCFAIVLTERLSANNATVEDITAMGRYPYSGWLGALNDEDRRIISEALNQTEMTACRSRFFNCLSDGEKQRVLISKALAQQTPYIFLDEPTAHLDLPNRIKTLLLLRELAHANQSPKSVIISTHELDLALQTADTIWLMTPNQGVEVGMPQQLIESGAFERAFADSHFRFDHSDGSLRIKI